MNATGKDYSEIIIVGPLTPKGHGRHFHAGSHLCPTLPACIFTLQSSNYLCEKS